MSSAPTSDAAFRHRPLDLQAGVLMSLLALVWGGNQVAVKLAAAGVSPVTQGALRSALAAVLVAAWARSRGVPLAVRDGTLAPGLAAGLLFGLEFVFLYAGLALTDASRMVVFLYLAPVLTVIGVSWFVRHERLSPLQLAGVAVAFGGIVLAFADGFFAGRRATLAGDLCGVAAAFLWAATTVLIRTTTLVRAPAEKTLLYQLAVCAPVMAVGAVVLGERGVVHLGPTELASLAYQAVVVAFASYLAWFWLLTRYLATRLAVLTFLAPVCGVLLGVAVLDEPFGGRFAIAAALVAAGIAAVNLAEPARR